jgi:hypothetical protein
MRVFPGRGIADEGQDRVEVQVEGLATTDSEVPAAQAE